MRKILVSECLYGGRAVRYDGKQKACDHPTFRKWKKQGRLIPVCPEVFGGLPIPREESQRQGDQVVTRSGRDVTEAFVAGAEEALRLAAENDVVLCILKEGSPSCGSNEIHDGTFTGTKIPGEGVAAGYLRECGFEVFSENEIEEAAAFLAANE